MSLLVNKKETWIQNVYGHSLIHFFVSFKNDHIWHDIFLRTFKSAVALCCLKIAFCHQSVWPRLTLRPTRPEHTGVSRYICFLRIMGTGRENDNCVGLKQVVTRDQTTNLLIVERKFKKKQICKLV